MLVYFYLLRLESLLVAYVVYRKYTINLPDAVTMGGAYDGGLASPVGFLHVEHSRLLRGTMQCVYSGIVSHEVADAANSPTLCVLVLSNIYPRPLRPNFSGSDRAIGPVRLSMCPDSNF